jgi:hypothetical protein
MRYSIVGRRFAHGKSKVERRLDTFRIIDYDALDCRSLICVMRVLGDALDRDFEMKANTQKVPQKRS